MTNSYLYIFFAIVLFSCNSKSNTSEIKLTEEQIDSVYANVPPPIFDSSGHTILERFNEPNKFKRAKVTKGSFAEYLRNLRPLHGNSFN